MAQPTPRRARYVAAGAVAAALAVAVPAWAGGGDDRSQAPANDPAAATQAVQDERRQAPDDRDCPKEGGSGSEQSSAGTSDGRQL